MHGPVWARCGLGEELEKYRGRCVERSGWKRALHNWKGLQEEMVDLNSKFVRVISKSQHNSLRLLIEWWNADYDSPETMATIRSAILRHSSGANGDERTPVGLSEYQSDYQFRLFECFQYELFFYGHGKTAPIQVRRQHACRAAARQRLAYWTFESASDHEQQQGDMRNRNPSPWNTVPLGAVIEACPWLQDDQKSSMPYYLWDLEAKKTVVVAELPNVPEYVVISHTWGRWRTNDDVDVPGIDDWAIPRNTIFDVTNLPEDLHAHRQLFSPCRYIWIDLFCVPQDKSERAKIEISRQGSIFSMATRAVAWLNTIDSWTGLQSGMHWLAAFYLHESGLKHLRPRVVTSVNAALSDSPSTEPQLFERRQVSVPGVSDIFEEPCGWFTSLWTLQESLLRPDLTFCNKIWAPFAMQNAAGPVAITLSCILSLVSWFQQNAPIDDDMPSCVAEIAALVQHLELTQLLETNPLAPLVLGNRRECERRRAEAIMSAVGATKWYRELDQSLHEQGLIFDRYPIQFLREIHENIGTRFFCANYGSFCCFWDIYRNSALADDVVLTPAGTLLPFDPLRDLSKMVFGTDSVDRIDEPSTNTWTLAEDGTVTMPQIAVVASTHPSINIMPAEAIEASLIVPLEAEPQKTVPMKGNLVEWMTSNFVGTPKIAICLLTDRQGWSQGAILMQADEEELPPKTFAKIGDYFTSSTVDVPTRQLDVNWTVL